MSKTFKDKPDKYQTKKKPPKEDRRFESSKGRKNLNIKNLVLKGYSLEEY